MSAKVNKENFEWEQSKFLNLESNNRPVKWVFNDIKNNEAEYIKYTNNTNKIIKVLNARAIMVEDIIMVEDTRVVF